MKQKCRNLLFCYVIHALCGFKDVDLMAVRPEDGLVGPMSATFPWPCLFHMWRVGRNLLAFAVYMQPGCEHFRVTSLIKNTSGPP